MEYSHTPDDAGKYASLAMAMMDDQKIIPHPNNFAVWYNYFAGTDPELKNALDDLLNSNQAVTEDCGARVYRRYCASPYEALPLHTMAEKLETELAHLFETVEQAEKGAAHYGKTLQDANGTMATLSDARGVKDVIARLMAETRAIIDQSRKVEHTLSQSRMRINQLTSELEMARREAMADALTGLANRKLFDAALSQAAMDSLDAGEPLSLLFIDVDHFKRFNDTHGHQVGDQVLKLMALMLNKITRGQDTVARYGGEEFAVILPQTGLSGARQVATKICTEVAAKVVLHRSTGGTLGRITVSIGVATLAKGESVREFIARADRALYLAKHRGRNRVATEEDLTAKPA